LGVLVAGGDPVVARGAPLWKRVVARNEIT
jgi:hypothetical protein